ncbi:MAG: hypothetical protein DGJ47_000742 [Rickettsiaceae bacterium]
MKIIARASPYLLYLMISLSLFTESIYSTALPNIALQLNTHGGIAQSSTAAYYFGFAFGVLTLGSLSDIYGRKPIILLGVLFYAFATFLITQCTDIKFFIICRCLQAYGASVCSVVSQAIARDSYKDWELSYLYANIAIVISSVPTIGTIFGGYIMLYYQEWQYVFWFLIANSLCMFLLYFRFLPETNANIGLDANSNFKSVLKALINDGAFLRYALIVGIMNGIYFSFIIQGPFVFIEYLQMDASQYGHFFITITISSLLGSFLTKYMVSRRYQLFYTRLIGFMFSLFGIIMLIIVSIILDGSRDITHHVVGIFGALSFLFLGYNMIVPMVLCTVLDNYQKSLGTAGSIFGFLYYMVTAVICFLVSFMHSNKINNYSYLVFCVLIIALILLLQAHKIEQIEASKNHQLA